MLDAIPVLLLVGSALGFLSGIGVGGGSLLMLWLTLVNHMPQQEARLLNLLFFVPAAAAASVFRWKQGTLPLRRILPAIGWGCVFAVIFSFVSSRMDTQLLHKLFGALLIVTGLREIFYRP